MRLERNDPVSALHPMIQFLKSGLEGAVMASWVALAPGRHPDWMIMAVGPRIHSMDGLMCFDPIVKKRREKKKSDSGSLI